MVSLFTAVGSKCGVDRSSFQKVFLFFILVTYPKWVWHSEQIIIFWLSTKTYKVHIVRLQLFSQHLSIGNCIFLLTERSFILCMQSKYFDMNLRLMYSTLRVFDSKTNPQTHLATEFFCWFSWTLWYIWFNQFISRTPSMLKINSFMDSSFFKSW